MLSALTIPEWLPIAIIAAALVFGQGVVNVVLCLGVTLCWLMLVQLNKKAEKILANLGDAVRYVHKKQVRQEERITTLLSGQSTRDSGSDSTTSSQEQADGTMNPDLDDSASPVETSKEDQR